MIFESNKSMLQHISYNIEISNIFWANEENAPVLCSEDLQITTRVRVLEYKLDGFFIFLNLKISPILNHSKCEY